eukprot:30087-Pelagococcus_subviridis.AAC.16
MTVIPNRHFGSSEGCANGRWTATGAPPAAGKLDGNAASTPERAADRRIHRPRLRRRGDALHVRGTLPNPVHLYRAHATLQHVCAREISAVHGQNRPALAVSHPRRHLAYYRFRRVLKLDVAERPERPGRVRHVHGDGLLYVPGNLASQQRARHEVRRHGVRPYPARVPWLEVLASDFDHAAAVAVKRKNVLHAPGGDVHVALLPRRFRRIRREFAVQCKL